MPSCAARGGADLPPPEAEILSGQRRRRLAAMREAARSLGLGRRAVLLKADLPG